MIQAVKRPAAQRDSFIFQGFPLGVNTIVPSEMLTPQEMRRCVDFRLGSNGVLIDRDPVIKHTTSTAMTGSPVSAGYAIVSGTGRDLIGASDYKLYYLNSTVATLIDTAEGTPYLVPFNDVCLVCDGGYLKYLDGVTTLKIAYDAGSDGTQFDNYSGDDDSGLNIGDGTNTRVAVKFTSDSWTSGYTIPLTQIDCKLKQVGSPTGTITAKLRLVADDTVLATTDLGTDAADISSTGEFVSFVFSSVTTEMSPGVAYYATIEHSGGDGSNHIQLRCTDTTGTAYYYSGSWTADATKQPIIKVYPGLPPKCSFGVVSNRRPFLGGDPDNPGYVWYGNLTHLDFSTTNGGGWIGVIDDNSNSFEVGAMQDLYGDLFIYGTEDQPYLSKLSGSQPSDFELPLTFQRAWSTQNTLVNVKNDLWNGSGDGVDAMSGVQEYGDFRSFSLTDSVTDIIEDYWVSSTAFAGYNPKYRHYMLHLPTYEKTLVGHIKNRVTLDDETTRYPWTVYDLPVTPTCFGQLSFGFVIGADDGYLYKFSSTAYKDLATTQVEPYFETSMVQFPTRRALIEQVQFVGGSLTGSSFKIDFYINGNISTYVLQLSASVSISDSLLVTEATGLLAEATGLLSSDTSPPRVDLNISCTDIKLKFHSFQKSQPSNIYFNGCFLKYRYLQV